MYIYFVSIFLPGESHGQRKSVDYSPLGCKESDRTEVTYTHAHMAETNTTLYNNHPPIKKNKKKNDRELMLVHSEWYSWA